MTATTDTTETPAVSPTSELRRLYKELAICNYIEATERKRSSFRFLDLMDMILKGEFDET